jgi:HSP20 family molecular chaperone IbpA
MLAKISVSRQVSPLQHGGDAMKGETIQMSEQASTPATRQEGTAPAPAQVQRMRRREPLDRLEELRAELARLLEAGPFEIFPFGRPLRSLLATSEFALPRVDVFERAGNLVVNAELPGVRKQDIDLRVEDGDLVLQAERQAEREVKDEHYYRMERRVGRLSRRLPLPDGVQADQIHASLTDGVLEVTIPMPKAAPASAQKIAIAGQGEHD